MSIFFLEKHSNSDNYSQSISIALSATPYLPSWAFTKLFISKKLTESHSFIVPSFEPDTRYSELFDKARLKITSIEL